MNIYGWVALLMVVGLGLWKFSSMIKAGMQKRHAENEARNHAEILRNNEKIDEEGKVESDKINKINDISVTDHLNKLFVNPDKADK